MKDSLMRDIAEGEMKESAAELKRMSNSTTYKKINADVLNSC